MLFSVTVGNNVMFVYQERKGTNKKQWLLMLLLLFFFAFVFKTVDVWNS